MNKTLTQVVALTAAFLIGLAGWLALQSGGVAHASHDSPALGTATNHVTNVGGVVIDLDALRPEDAAITFVCCVYNPTVVTITVGESVSWSGNFGFPHPLRQVDGPTSDVVVPGGFANSTGTFYSVQFSTPGTFYYQCQFHGTFGGSMRGSIIVLPSGGSTATPTATSVPPTATPTFTPVPPSATPTETPTETALPPTATATETPPATATNTIVPPTSTPTATHVADPVPTDTPTVTPTGTPTGTPTPTSTPTLAPVAFLPAVLR